MHEEQYSVIEKAYNSNTYYEEYRKDRKLTDCERTLLKQFVSELPRPGKQVLDIGCGDADLYDSYLRYRCGCDITGVDISARQIRKATDRLKNCHFIHGNFLTVCDESMFGKYDGILCMYTLFNFMEEDQLTALQLMNKCLKENGTALINVRKEVTVSMKYALKWCGEPMYWSLPGVTQTLLWCTQAGFSCRVFTNPDNSDYVFILLRKEHSI